MADGNGCEVFTDAAWAMWEPLIEEVRPRGKTPPKDLRRTISAIPWRRRNGAKRRGIPAELGPWWLAAQLFLRWAEQGVVWGRLLDLVQRRGVALGTAFLDGTTVRAHQKAAGAKRGVRQPGARRARSAWPLSRRLRHEGRPAGSPTAADGRSPSRSRPDRPTSRRWRRACSIACRTCRDGSSATAASPPTPSASASGTWARGPRSRPSAPTRRSPVPTGSTPTAASSRTCGRGWLKEWRAVATRYEKTARSFLGVLCIAATADWLKVAKL